MGVKDSAHNIFYKPICEEGVLTFVVVYILDQIVRPLHHPVVGPAQRTRTLSSLAKKGRARFRTFSLAFASQFWTLSVNDRPSVIRR